MAVSDKELAVVKALTRSPLSLAEVDILLDASFSDLMSENDLDHVQAQQVKMWTEHEDYRHRSQYLISDYRNPDYDLPVEKIQYRIPPGDFALPVRESVKRRVLKNVLKKAIRRYTK
jgi:hypothetical protein